MVTHSQQSYRFCVVGGGLIGTIAALRLGRLCDETGGTVAHLAPENGAIDPRTTAMMTPSISILEELGLWRGIKPITAPLSTMRLVDATKRLIRAPLTDFKASELDLEAFGYNVPNAALLELLDAKLKECPSIHRIAGQAINVTTENDSAIIHTDTNDTIRADLAIAADGKNSVLRTAAGIETKAWSYPQTAVVLNFSHTLPHGAVSTEFHTESGPFTQVPLPPTQPSKHRSSLVWMVEPDRADSLLQTDLQDLSLMVEEQMQSWLGKCSIENVPKAFPMSGMTAQAFGHQRTVLVGEAGHVFPPIGAQGFNLGMKDVDDLMSLVTQSGNDLGTIANLYDQKRRSDVHLKTFGVDMLNRSLLTGFLPVQMARAAGLSALGAISPLRKLAMRQGMGSRQTG